MASDDWGRTIILIAKGFSAIYLAYDHPMILVLEGIHNLQSYLESFSLDVLLDLAVFEFS